MKKFVALVLVAVFYSCSNDDTPIIEDPIACTEEFVYGLSVQVRDAATGAVIPNGVTVVARDNDYSETLNFVFDTHVGAGERPGTYEITATKEGYTTQMAGPITVAMDEDMCHVITQTVMISLKAN